jgi:hypothetical protein
VSEPDKIFISHASADKGLAELLRDTLVLGGVPEGRIFYSSSRATGIPMGVDVRDRLRLELQQAGLVIELVSKTFLTRTMCVLELGAAWALEKPSYPIVVPPLTRDEAVQEIGNVHMGMLHKDHDVDDVFDELHDRLNMDLEIVAKTVTWNRSIRKFKEALPAALAPSTSYPMSIGSATRTTGSVPSARKSGKIEILNYSLVDTRYGVEVHGEAANNDKIEHTASIKATFYDEDGKIVGIADGIVNQIDPGDTKTFSLSSSEVITAFSRVKVQVDSVF